MKKLSLEKLRLRPEEILNSQNLSIIYGGSDPKDCFHTFHCADGTSNGPHTGSCKAPDGSVCSGDVAGCTMAGCT